MLFRSVSADAGVNEGVISAGNGFSVYLTETGAMYAAGINDDARQMGDGDAYYAALVPTPVGANSDLELSAALVQSPNGTTSLTNATFSGLVSGQNGTALLSRWVTANMESVADSGVDFGAADPLPDKIILTKDQNFIVDKNSVYRDRKSVV